jgi:hypothetical protein
VSIEDEFAHNLACGWPHPKSVPESRGNDEAFDASAMIDNRRSVGCDRVDAGPASQQRNVSEPWSKLSHLTRGLSKRRRRHCSVESISGRIPRGPVE